MNDLVSIAKSSVFYRVAVRSFFDSDADGVGDLRGLIAKLPYFLYLETDSVILTDVIESDHDGVTDFCRVDPAVGTNEDLEELIAAMHSENLKVYLSFSPIFTSTAHSWFEKSAKSPDLNHFREYYVWKSGKDAKGKTPPDDRKTRSKESAWTFQKGYWYFSESGKGRPSLNYDNLRVRKEMLEVLRFWREKAWTVLCLKTRACFQSLLQPSVQSRFTRIMTIRFRWVRLCIVFCARSPKDLLATFPFYWIRMGSIPRYFLFY
ncbi:MAG: hypothetical protein J5765_03220 [Clostridia bacterium]|nr:hypothetical protein [Clostridia bacterium]